MARENIISEYDEAFPLQVFTEEVIIDSASYSNTSDQFKQILLREVSETTDLYLLLRVKLAFTKLVSSNPTGWSFLLNLAEWRIETLRERVRHVVRMQMLSLRLNRAL